MPDSTSTTPPTSPRRSLGERVVSATLAIAVAHALAKLFGSIQWSVISYYYPPESGVTDSFFLAFEGILWSLFLIGEESIGPAFLPAFIAAREKDGEKDAWHFTSVLLNLQFLLLAAAVALLMAFPKEAIDRLTLFQEPAQGAGRAERAVRFLYLMAPALFGLSIGSLTYMVLNGYKKFFWPAFADAALKAGMMGGIVAGQFLGLSDDALVVGVLAAGATKLAVHLFALGGKLKLYRLSFDLRQPHLRKFFVLVAPLVLGIVFAKVRDYFNNFYILSELKPGMLSANSFGRKIFNAVASLVPYPLSIAIFPYLCEMVARDDRGELAAFLTRTSRMLLMVFLPATGVLMLLSIPLAQALFQGGMTGAETARLYGEIGVCYTLVLPAVALEMIYMQAFFSTYRTGAVTVIGIVFSSLSMAISYVGVMVYGLHGPEGVMVVALGYTFSRWLKTLALIVVQRALGLRVFPFLPTLSFLARALVLTAACTGVAQGGMWGVERVLPAPPAEAIEAAEADEAGKTAPKTAHEAKTEAGEPEAKTGEASEKKPKGQSKLKVLLRAAPNLAVPGALALLVFVLGCKLLRFEEFDVMVGYAKEKLKRRRERGSPPAESANP
ncbi:MAG: hypothetical protein M5U26_10585 [Planctomycetota bacterium]|nr:hypothetical protein [Planctomycetota bacterium]